MLSPSTGSARSGQALSKHERLPGSLRLLFVVALLLSAPPAAAAGAPPPVAATSAVLLDVQTGRVLYAQAPHLRRPPASTTKIMTALLVAESLTPDTLVPISRRASEERSGSIGLEVGEQWKAGDLMRALLMHSANDAAVALAEAVAGSVEAFAEQMNARAAALGARDTHFVTPHGWFHPQHYSTAHDLALIAREALRNPWIAQIVRSQTWDLQRNGETKMLINTNKLLWRYPGADGVKTGWIAESGPCLIASATRDGWQLIAVVLNSSEIYHDAAALLNYGFGEFTITQAVSRGAVVQTVPVTKGVRPLTALAAEDGVIAIRRGASVQRRVFLTTTSAPIRAGETVGNLQLVSDGVQVGQVPLVARDAVPVRSVFVRFWLWVRGLAGGGGLP